jgi:hypothetical protein
MAWQTGAANCDEARLQNPGSSSNRDSLFGMTKANPG